MGADYSFEVKNIEKHNNSSVATVIKGNRFGHKFIFIATFTVVNR